MSCWLAVGTRATHLFDSAASRNRNQAAHKLAPGLIRAPSWTRPATDCSSRFTRGQPVLVAQVGRSDEVGMGQPATAAGALPERRHFGQGPRSNPGNSLLGWQLGGRQALASEIAGPLPIAVLLGLCVTRRRWQHGRVLGSRQRGRAGADTTLRVRADASRRAGALATDPVERCAREIADGVRRRRDARHLPGRQHLATGAGGARCRRGSSIHVSTLRPRYSAHDFFAGAIEAVTIGTVTYAVPWYVDTRLLFYRADLLRAAGYNAAATHVAGLARGDGECAPQRRRRCARGVAPHQRMGGTDHPGDAERRQPAARRRSLRQLSRRALRRCV